MKIECMTEKLVEAIGKSEKITGKNLTLPVLSCILLEAKGKQLTLRATNLDVGIEITFRLRLKKREL
jgi:DNA polymerase III sliding clamp (beta) subunit (PCNA family)